MRSSFNYLYPSDMPLKQKIERICREIYGAGSVVFDPTASSQLDKFERYGWGHLPICMAKTSASISHNPALKNAPRGFEVHVRAVRAAIGAGFIYPLLGEISTMPGLNSSPAYARVDINLETGRVVGLF